MPKRLLDLFSGTGSITKVARELGYEVISLDRDMEADIKIDIMAWDPRIYPHKYFDVIHASKDTVNCLGGFFCLKEKF